MPELTAAKRGAGAWVKPGVAAPRRHYTPDDLTGQCGGCGNPLPRVLWDDGMRRHPTCYPEHAVLAAQAARGATNPPPRAEPGTGTSDRPAERP